MMTQDRIDGIMQYLDVEIWRNKYFFMRSLFILTLIYAIFLTVLIFGLSSRSDIPLKAQKQPQHHQKSR